MIGRAEDCPHECHERASYRKTRHQLRSVHYESELELILNHFFCRHLRW